MMESGKLYAYVGTMGAGKSKKLCSLYHKLIDEGKHVIAFKHTNDVMRGGHEDKIVSRNGDSVPAVAISSLADTIIYETEKLYDAILIDEIQFFDDDHTLETIEGMLISGIDVYVFGLDVTSEFKTFGLMGHILARADEVKKLKTRCHKCGAPARVSAYIGVDKKSDDVKIGDLGEYVPMCRMCYLEENEDIPVDGESGKEDPFYETSLVGNTFGVNIGVYESELKAAGYTIEQVKDINSDIGIKNLLKDLGFI